MNEDKLKLRDNKLVGCQKDAQGHVDIPDGTTEITHGPRFPIKNVEKMIKSGHLITDDWVTGFQDCKNITSIKIPASLTRIETGAFVGCDSLKEFIVDENNEFFCAEGGMLFNKDRSTLISFPSAHDKVSIPNSVTEIAESAFCGCKFVTNIIMPNSVIKIGKQAFRSCTLLTSIKFSENLAKIENGAFEGCPNLLNLDLPNNVSYIGNGIFGGCPNIVHFVIPNGITNIFNGMFKNCTSLTSIEIPQSVTSIEEQAFADCPNLNNNIWGWTDNNVLIIGDAGQQSFQERIKSFISQIEDELNVLRIPSVEEISSNPGLSIQIFKYGYLKILEYYASKIAAEPLTKYILDYDKLLRKSIHNISEEYIYQFITDEFINGGGGVWGYYYGSIPNSHWSIGDIAGGLSSFHEIRVGKADGELIDIDGGFPIIRWHLVCK